MTGRRGGLGRGLESLIPGIGADTERAGTTTLDIDALEPNPLQPRFRWNEEQIDALAASIREHGIIQPIVVSRRGSAKPFQIIAGERRWRAAQRAGLSAVPVLVREATPSQVLELALVENVQRADLNPIEEALAYHQLHEEFNLTQEEIAKRVGKERSTVANFLRLMKLPDSVKKLLASGQLSMGHARAFLALDSAKKQEQLAERVVKRNLNVRQTEMLAAEASPKAAEPEKEKDVFTRDAEDKLTRTLRSRVEIDRKRRGGIIHIKFGSEDELIRLVDELMRVRR